MFQYDLVIKGNDIFERSFEIDATSFEEAFEEAKCILNKISEQTIEQIDIVSLEVQRL